jgi:MarR family transcriptional regulator for hemolysin
MMNAPEVRIDSDDFGRVLNMTAHAWRLALDRRLRPLGLSRATWQVLVLVRKLEAPSQSRLAEHLGLEGPSIVRLVDRLEREDLVERRVGGDRRVKTVHLTRKGEELSTEIWRVASHLRKELLRDIPLDDVARAMTLLTLLQGRLARLA